MTLSERFAGLVNALLSPRWQLVRTGPEATPSGSDREAAETCLVADPDQHDQGEAQRYFPLGPDAGLTRLQDGHFLYVDPADDSVAAHLIARGVWEDWIHRVICALVKPGDRIVEVGANFGYYTVAMADRVGNCGSVLAVEANPRVAGLLERSVRFNGYADRIEVLAKAVSDRASRTGFVVCRRNAGGGATANDPEGLGPDGVLIEVETVTLDTISPEGVRLIRIDAEGSEPLILRGAARLLQRPDVVVCMEWDVVQMQARADVDATVAWLSGMGFRFWKIRHDSALLEIPADRMASLGPCDVVVSRAPPDEVRIADVSDDAP